MGALSDYLAAAAGAPAPFAPPEAPSIGGELSKGVSRGMRNAGANVLQATGLGAEALGFDSAARSLRGGAQTMRQAAEAPEFAPESPTWDNVKGFGQTARWAAGHAGEIVPIAGAGVAGGFLGGPVGAGAAMLPDMVGQIDQGQQADPTQAALPVATRGMRALGMGAVGAAVQSVPFGSGLVGGAAAKSLAGAAAKNIGAGVVTGAVGSGLGDVAVQRGVNPEAPIDMARVTDATVGGGIVGGAFHAPGVVTSLAKGAGTSVGELAGRARTAVTDRLSALPAAAEKAGIDLADRVGTMMPTKETGIEIGARARGVVDNLSDLAAQGRERLNDTAGKIIRGEPVGIDMNEFASATKERAEEMLNLGDNKALQAAKKWGEDLIARLPSDDPRIAKVSEALANVTDRAGQTALASAKVAYDLGERAYKKISEAHALAREGWEAYKPGKDTKQSEDYSGVQQAVLGGIQGSGLIDRRPDLFENPKAMGELASTLRMTLDQMTRGQVSAKQRKALTDILGDDTEYLMNSLKKSLKENLEPEEAATYFKNLEAFGVEQRRGSDLNNKLKALMTPEHQKAVSGYDLMGLRDGLVAHARGDHLNSPEARRMSAEGQSAHDRLANRLAHQLYAEHFGANADKAYQLIQKEAGFALNDTAHNELPLETHQALLARSMPDYTGEVDEHGRGVRRDHTEYAPAGADKAVFDEDGNRVVPQEMDTARFGVGDVRADGGQRMVLVSKRPGAPKANPTSEQNLKFKQHMADLKAMYPEDAGFSVKFEKTPGREDGHFVVESPKDPEKFSIEDMDSMKMNTKLHANSPSKIQVGGHNLDTMRITAAVRRSMGADELPATYKEQLAEAFKRGIARLTAQFGKVGEPIVISDEARIGSIGGKDVTWGDVKRMRHGETQSEALHRELNDVTSAWARATWSDERLASAKMTRLDLTDAEVRGLAAKYKELLGQVELARELELSGGNDTQERGGMGKKVSGNFVGAAARGRDPALGSTEGNSPRARSWRAQNRDKNPAGPYEDKATGLYDADGNLTRAGVRQMLEGDAHGGIDVRNQGEVRGRDRETYLDEQRGGANLSGEAQARIMARDLAKVDDDRIGNPSRLKYDASGKLMNPAGGDITPMGGVRGRGVDTDLGQGRRTMGKDENIHLTAAMHGNDGAAFATGGNEFEPRRRGESDEAYAKRNARWIRDRRENLTPNEELVNRTNMAGEAHWPNGVVDRKTLIARNALSGTVDKWLTMDRPDVQKNAERALRLMQNVDMLSKADAGKLMRLAENNEWAPHDAAIAEAAEVLKGLLIKYRPMIEVPGERASSISSKGDYAPNPVRFNADGTVVSAKPTTRVPPINEGRKATWIGNKGEKAASDNGKLLPAKPEGAPDPKAQAAVKAAIQEKATSGDHEALAGALVERFAPDMKLKVVEDDTIPGRGRLAAHPDGTFTMKLRPGLLPVDKAAVVAHEFGHALQLHVFDRAAPEVQGRIKAAWEADVAAMATATGNDMVAAFGHVGSALRMANSELGKAPAEIAIAHRDSLARPGYTLSFNEWFANQVSKYATSNDFSGLHPEAQTFWKQAVAVLKDAYQQIIKALVPHKDFASWMTELAKSVETEMQGKRDRLVERALGDHPGLLKELKTTNDVKGLQRAARELSERAPTSKALELANARLDELSRDPDVAYGLMTTKYDRTVANAAIKHTPEQHQAVRDHIEKTLGPKVAVEFANLSHAGEFQRMKTGDVIRLSVHALDPMSTAYHESLHGFFAQLRDAGAHDVMGVLEKAAQSQHVMQQLRERYKSQPEVLRQMADPEERVAYMYQTWASDPTFKIPPAHKSVFTRIADFIRNLMGVWTNDERALHILDYFHSGEYAKNNSSPIYVRRAMMETHRSAILDSAAKLAEPVARLADAVVATGSGRLRDTGIPAMRELADIIKREHTAEGGDQGFIQAARVENSKRMAVLGERLLPYSDPAHLADAMQALQAQTPAKTPEGRLAAAVIRKALRETHAYMTEAGVNVGDLGENYFPRVWDIDYISKNQQAFRDMLEPYVRKGDLKGSVDKLIGNLISRGGVELGIESREPGMQFTKGRVLDFIKPLDAAEFVSKDLMATLTSYMAQATRKAEWTRRLGNGKLEALMEKAREQGATPEHFELAESYMKGVDGTLGDTLNPDARRLMGNMIVYQNVRLLPAAAFSMLIDPNGIMVRGGTVGDAWNAFKRGMAGIPKTFDKEGGEVHDQATKWAELVGVVDSAMVTHAMGDLYTQGMVGGTAKKINDAFFKYNFVEGLNRNFRIGATEAAIKFLARHSDALEGGLGDSTHSLRWMKELGLQKGDVIKTKDGIALTKAEGLSAEQEKRVHGAINQWVDGAILRPDAADKPVWMNDPHFALISHLKQFVYAFQKTILERTLHEIKHGNYTPLMALASYVPVMMAADMARGLVTTGGQPTWQAGWGPVDYLEYALERAGMFGVGQIPLDMAKDIKHGGSGIGALAGPTFEQLSDIVGAVGGHRQWGNTVLSAMPANALVKGWSGKGIQDAGPTASD